MFVIKFFKYLISYYICLYCLYFEIMKNLTILYIGGIEYNPYMITAFFFSLTSITVELHDTILPQGSPYAHDSDVPMQGSPYAADRRRGYRRRYYRRAAPGEEGEVVEEGGDYVPTMRGRGRGGYRGRGPRRFYRGRFFGRGRGRGAGRGAFYPGFNDYEGGEVAEVVDGMSIRGRGRGRGRVRGRGGRGPRGYFRRYYGGGAARPQQYDQMMPPDDAPRRRFRRAGRGRGRGGRYNGTPETRVGCCC